MPVIYPGSVQLPTQPFRLSLAARHTRLFGAIVTGALGVAALGAIAPDRIDAAQAGSARQKALYVSVVDKEGAPVADVKPDDLIVREDGVAREVLRVEPATDPDAGRAARRQQPGGDRGRCSSCATLSARSSTRSPRRATGVVRHPRPIGRRCVVDATTDATALKKKGIDRLFAQPGAGHVPARRR